MRISDWSSDVCSSDLALDAFLDLKTRDDPLIQASARHTHAYLSQGRHGLKALHGIPVRNFRTLLSIKTRRPLGEDLRRQVEEQLAKLDLTRSEEHTSELQSLMRISYAVFCLKKKKKYHKINTNSIIKLIHYTYKYYFTT